MNSLRLQIMTWELHWLENGSHYDPIIVNYNHKVFVKSIHAASNLVCKNFQLGHRLGHKMLFQYWSLLAKQGSFIIVFFVRRCWRRRRRRRRQSFVVAGILWLVETGLRCARWKIEGRRFAAAAAIVGIAFNVGGRQVKGRSLFEVWYLRSDVVFAADDDVISLDLNVSRDDNVELFRRQLQRPHGLFNLEATKSFSANVDQLVADSKPTVPAKRSNMIGCSRSRYSIVANQIVKRGVKFYNGKWSGTVDRTVASDIR